MRALRHDPSHMRLGTTLSWRKLVFPVFVLLVLPGTVLAGFFSSFFSGIGDIFTEVNRQEKNINSQNIALLAAAAGPELSKNHQSTPEVDTVGGSALLASVGPSGGPANTESDAYDHGQISIYIVREGDSFTSIAEMFEVSVNTILWANDLPRGAKLQIGQTLVILPVSGVQYTVKKGDTLAAIAKKFKGDPDEIRSFNRLEEDDVLEVGSLVIIPDGEIPTLVATPTSRPATSKLRAAGGPIYDGYYAAPLPAGYRRTQGLHGYNGVDLALYRGAPVLAAAGGQVIIARGAGYNGGYGKYVVVAHGNGTQTLYGHLNSVTVSPGEVVFAGQQVGTVGNTGRSTGPHLHFEIRGAKNPF